MNKKLILKISGMSPYPHNLFVGFSINKLLVAFNKFGMSNLLGHLGTHSLHSLQNEEFFSSHQWPAFPIKLYLSFENSNWP